MLGKSSSEIENREINNLNPEKFEKFMKDIFLKKRKERVDLAGEEKNYEIEKRIFLQVIDMNWKNHIQYLEQLRQVIGLRSYGNRDPLIEYKKEAYALFENLLNKIKYDLITILINLKVVNNMSEENVRI